jgi:hypothetical protein
MKVMMARSVVVTGAQDGGSTRSRVLFAGAVVAALAVAASVAGLIASARAAAVSRQRPPTPTLSTLGVKRPATLVSYCWTRPRSDGSRRGICADGVPGHPARTLPWRAGTKIVLDLRLPAHRVTVQAVRISVPGARPTHVIEAHAAASDASGRRWVFRLSRKARVDTELLIFGRFAQGDAEAELGIRSIESR